MQRSKPGLCHSTLSEGAMRPSRILGRNAANASAREDLNEFRSGGVISQRLWVSTVKGETATHLSPVPFVISDKQDPSPVFIPRGLFY